MSPQWMKRRPSCSSNSTWAAPGQWLASMKVTLTPAASTANMQDHVTTIAHSTNSTLACGCWLYATQAAGIDGVEPLVLNKHNKQHVHTRLMPTLLAGSPVPPQKVCTATSSPIGLQVPSPLHIATCPCVLPTHHQSRSSRPEAWVAAGGLEHQSAGGPGWL